MNQFKNMRYLSAVIIMVMLYVSGCKTIKEAIPCDAASPARSEPVVVNFDRTNAFTVESYKSRQDWAAYKLLPDQAKGEAWATQVSDNVTKMTFYLGTLTITPEFITRVIKGRQFIAEQDTYIPKELVAKAYRNAGITKTPAEIVIRKGNYPVEVVNQPPNSDAKGKWVITTETSTAYLDNGSVVVTVKVTAVWVDP